MDFDPQRKGSFVSGSGRLKALAHYKLLCLSAL